MGTIRAVRPVSLICGLIGHDTDLMARAIRLLADHQGPTDEVSAFWPFDATDYYLGEMGDDLQRQFVSFERLIQPNEIPHIKQLTHQLEEKICYDLGLPIGQRRVNLDPGYLTLSKLVLATTKDFSHRIYLGDGIYAESTLHYEDGGWVPWPWTYPDYADGRYNTFFVRVRDRHKAKLNARAAGESAPERRPT